MSITALAIVEKEIRGNEVMAKISNSLGKPMTDPSVMKYVNGAIMYMQSKVGQKGDVSHCSKQSIVDSLINAATVRLPVDSKHYACLIAYGSTCTFQPEWRGYVAKVREADASAKVTAYLIYKGDKFTHSTSNGNAFYSHERKDSLNDNIDDMIGAFCYIKTDTGSSIKVLSRAMLDDIRASSKAGYGYIWKDWPHEQYIKTIIRSACKIEFTEAVAALDAMDNRLFVEKTGEEAPKIAPTSPLPPVQEAVAVVPDKQPEPPPEEIEAKAQSARDRLHAEDEKPAVEAPKALPEGVKLAKGNLTYRAKANGGGYIAYCVEGYQTDEGKDMRFSTNDPTIIETLNAKYDKELPVGIEYTTVVNGAYTNYNIVGLISVE